MADPHSKKTAPSPISQLLKTLGMTREDLVQHTEQMRAHLSQPSPTRATERSKSRARLGQRSRTTSVPNLAIRNRSSTPPTTPVKSEPVEHPIPSRQMDTMQLVMERKSRQAKRERRGMPFNTSVAALRAKNLFIPWGSTCRFPLATTRKPTRFHVT